MTAAEAKAMILESKVQAAAHAKAILAEENPDYDFLNRELRAYILCKFHLTEAECQTENFEKLAGLSLSKSMNLSPELVKEYDMARSCDGVTSQTAKMLLLFMAIQRDLSIKLPPMETAYAETLEDICIMVWKAMGNKPLGSIS